MEETDYTPFGLTMSGISSKALNFGSPENKYKANAGTELASKEFSDGSGLELYETDFRRYDAQIGRFTGIDALSTFAPNQSPYSFVQNNPILFVDPQGLDTVKTSINNGKINIPGQPNSETVLKIDNGDGTFSYYNYDPNNSAANSQGYVGAGTEGTNEGVTVTAKAKSKSNSTVAGYDFPTKDQVMWAIDGGFSISEASRATFRLTNGAYNGSKLSLKLYSSGWGGGSRAAIKTFKVSNAAKIGSRTLFGVSLVYDGIGVYKYYSGANDPNAFFQPVNPAKATVNTGVGVYSLWINPAAGVVYFGLEAFYPGGVGGAANKMAEIESLERKITGHGFINGMPKE